MNKKEAQRMIGIGLVLAGDKSSNDAKKIWAFIDSYNRVREQNKIEDEWRSIKKFFFYGKMSTETRRMFREFLFLEVHR